MKQKDLNIQYDRLRKDNLLLPIKISNFYQKKLSKEIKQLGNYSGPLCRAVYPSIGKLTLKAPLEVADFVEDEDNVTSNTKQIIQKYNNRLLYLPTYVCVANCQYCFRQDFLSKEKDRDDESLFELIDYLNDNPHVNEVILSGGDPLILSYKKLKKIIESILKHTQVSNIRIHTRSIIYNPNLLTKEKLELFQSMNIRLVFHIIHPYEICNIVEQKIKECNNYGIRLYNQFPILRHINDHYEVLLKLLTKLDDLHIRNLSIFIPDPIKFSAIFRLRLERLFNIIDELNLNSSSWINSTRVVLDTKIGKVRRDNILKYDDDNNIIIFKRNGKEVIYPDLQKEIDIAGDVTIMLWQDYKQKV